MHINIAAVTIIITSQVNQDRPIVGGPRLSRAPFGQLICYLNKCTLDFLKWVARSNAQILKTDVYIETIADGRKLQDFMEKWEYVQDGFSLYGRLQPGSQFRT